MYDILEILKIKMNTPELYGTFHIVVLLTVIMILVQLMTINKNEKNLKRILMIYSIVGLILEFLKQLSWSFNESLMFDYQWYAFPFQLCTTPLYLSFLCIFLKEGKFRSSLFSYMAYISILGSITTMVYPVTCFVDEILVNIHTMWLHGGSLVVSVYLLMNEKLKFKDSIYVFLVLVCIANGMNLLVYHSGLLNGETFNMFYISPYFISSLPVFDVIQENVPYFLFLFLYIFALTFGGLLIYFITYIVKKLTNTNYHV